jgi:hypothetical protein
MPLYLRAFCENPCNKRYIQIKSYLKFLWHSKNEHAVHSHSLWLLNVFTTGNQNRNVLKEYRKTLLENRNTIEVTDFGAGSKVFKSNKAEIPYC